MAAGSNGQPWEGQHKYLQEQLQDLQERVKELEGIVRILSDGHGLTEEIRPTPDKGH